MNISQVQSIAREMGIKPGKRRKMELIRAIQREEGSFDCYATAYEGVCDQLACAWRNDCFKASRQKLT